MPGAKYVCVLSRTHTIIDLSKHIIVHTVHTANSSTYRGACVRRGLYGRTQPTGVASRIVACVIRLIGHTYADHIFTASVCLGREYARLWNMHYCPRRSTEVEYTSTREYQLLNTTTLQYNTVF